MLYKDFREFLELLNEKEVKYLIVGGYAVSVHGFPRYTGDIDVFIQSSPDNAQKLLNALDDFGFGSLELTVQDFAKEDSIVQIGYPPYRIDILTTIEGVEFNECFKNKLEIEFDELKIPFIGYNDLIKNKKASGRTKDKIDIENLKKS